MTDTDARDAGLMAAADATMDAIGKTLIKAGLAPRGVDWRDDEAGFVVRDGFLAALRAERVRGGESMRDRAWQPIETAPKGRRILLRVRPREHLGHMTEAVAVGEWHESPNKDRRRWDGWSTDLGPFRNATGWMPLPPSPPRTRRRPMDDARALAGRLRDASSRPGRDNPDYICVVSVADAKAAADLLDRLAAPEGVGLTRYAKVGDAMMRARETGEWVRHEDAAAALAAKEYELKRFHEARANAPDYEVLWAEQTERADAAEAERDALKAALAPLTEIAQDAPAEIARRLIAVSQAARAALSKTQGGG